MNSNEINRVKALITLNGWIPCGNHWHGQEGCRLEVRTHHIEIHYHGNKQPHLQFGKLTDAKKALALLRPRHG